MVDFGYFVKSVLSLFLYQVGGLNVSNSFLFSYCDFHPVFPQVRLRSKYTFCHLVNEMK